MLAFVSRTWQSGPTERYPNVPWTWHYTVRMDGGSYSRGGFDSQYLARIAAQAFAQRVNNDSKVPPTGTSINRYW